MPSTGLEKSQSHTGPEYKYQDKKSKNFGKPTKKRDVTGGLDESTKFDPNSYDKLFQNALGKNHKQILLGHTKHGPIYLYHPLDMSKKRVLVVAGQHGEEPGGPWALLQAIKNSPMLDKLSVSFIPVANPYGFKTGHRADSEREYTNWFINDDGDLRDGGEVVQTFTRNIKLLKSCGQNALLNVHEDNTSKGFYLYILGDTGAGVVKAILNAGKQRFEFKKDGKYHDNGTYELKNGIVDNHHDGTLDNFLFSRGTPITITMEIPSVEAPISDRIRMGSELINAFLDNI